VRSSQLSPRTAPRWTRRAPLEEEARQLRSRLDLATGAARIDVEPQHHRVVFVHEVVAVDQIAARPVAEPHVDLDLLDDVAAVVKARP
jgi:hypothetical protein